VKILKGMFWGGLIGGIVVAPDGAILGMIFGNAGLGALAGLLAGAILGATGGGIAGAVGPRLVLKPPPADNDNATIEPRL
jgi:hypothetical protein